MQKYLPLVALATIIGCNDQYSRTTAQFNFDRNNHQGELTYDQDWEPKQPSLLRFARWEEYEQGQKQEHNFTYDVETMSLEHSICDPENRYIIFEERINKEQGEIIYTIQMTPTRDPSSHEYLGLGCTFTSPSDPAYPQDYLSITKGSIQSEPKCLELYLLSHGEKSEPDALAGLSNNFKVRDLLQQRRIMIVGQMALIKQELENQINPNRTEDHQ